MYIHTYTCSTYVWYVQYAFPCNTYTHLHTYIHNMYVAKCVCNPSCLFAVLILWVSWILPPVMVESSSSSRGEESPLLVPPTPQPSSRSCHIRGNTTYSSFFKKFETISVESSQVCTASLYIVCVQYYLRMCMYTSVHVGIMCACICESVMCKYGIFMHRHVPMYIRNIMNISALL